MNNSLQRSAALRIGVIFTALLQVLPGALLMSCDALTEPFADIKEIDPCDPASGAYAGRKHFIERYHLNEDGTVDYRKMFKNTLDKRSSPCDPLYGKETQPSQ